ncbi:MAG: glycogen synthase GlgA [Desulfobacteraceae bacterium]|nr:MAG: glycogen synthase GlgA [Desulfobacteraceae bacterium]
MKWDESFGARGGRGFHPDCRLYERPIAVNDSINILFLSSEAAPYAKTGGLADVAGSLPGALKRLGVNVSVGLPLYRSVREGSFQRQLVLKGLKVPLAGQTIVGNVHATETEDGVPVYFFEREDLFDRPNLYRTAEGDYYDNLERFAFFCRAALLFAKVTGMPFDLIHCHDWQTGLIPAYLSTLFRTDPFFSATATLFTIHNIGYQGLFPREKLPVCGLPPETYHPEGVEYWGKISLLKAGIVYSEAVTTVSPTYSREIQTSEFGLGMEGILRKKSAALHGILNGADYSVWDPAIDPHIASNYDSDHLSEKIANKAALLRQTGLESSLLERPVLGMTSRLSHQKGCDLFVPILDELVRMKVGLVILGEGEERYERRLREAAERYRGKVSVTIGFDEALAHRIMAGVDIFLVPSHYEPCGLTQMYALKYGTVPVVRATGGLEDTIEDFDPLIKTGNGFKFGPYDSKAFLSSIQRAMDLYSDQTTWEILMRQGMAADFSWKRSAERYVEIYQSLIAARRRV